MKVAILSGGFSEERHSSRESAESVVAALTRLGHEPYIVEYDADFLMRLREISPDAVFHLTQGKHHGDGAAQAILELLGLPYTGSRPHAAAVINHKTLCKKIWLAAATEILTPPFFELSREEYESEGFAGFLEKAETAGLALPIVVKAPTQGGRFGIVFVKDERSFGKLDEPFQYDDVLLCERYVEGRFIAHGILEIEGKLTALPPVEIIDTTGDEFKLYNYGTTAADPGFTQERIAEINHVSLTAAKLVGASGVARLDYHLSGGELYLLEINANPGLKPNLSDMTECAKAAGYSYDELIALILATAKKG